MVVGRLLSYLEGNFSGAMLNFGRVITWNNPKQLEKPCITKGQFLGLIFPCNKVIMVDPGFCYVPTGAKSMRATSKVPLDTCN